MFSYFIIGNVTLKSEQTLTSAVYGYTYSKLSMSEINACLYASESKLSKLHLVLQNAYILCKFSNSFASQQWHRRHVIITWNYIW